MASKKFYHDIDLVNVGQLVGARIQNVTTAEKTTLASSLGTGNKGLQVWDTDLDAPFIWSGAAWLRDALEVSGDIVYKGAINPTNADSVDKVSGFQYVVDTAGTLTATGVTFSPSGVVEVGDVVLFTDATSATVLQRNNEQATETSLGIVELATQVEVDTGTDTIRVVTPATLAGSQLATDVSELDTFTGIGTTLDTTATDLAAAINEHEADIGSMSLDTTATDLTAAINEHEADIGTVANLTTTATDLVTAINEHETDIGTVANLTTTATDLVTAINELDAENGTVTALAMGTTASTLSGGVAELSTYTGNGTTLTTTATDLAAAVNEIDAELGTITALAMGTTASTVSGAISELHTFTGNGTTLNTTANDLAAAINEHEADIGTVGSLTTTATSLVTAINEHETDIGTVGSLTTTATSLVTAINEHEADIGTVADLDTTATDLTGAVNEVHSELMKKYFNSSVSLTADVAQTITHNLALTNKDYFTIRVADSTGADIEVQVVSVGVTSLEITSSVSITGVKVCIIGF